MSEESGEVTAEQLLAAASQYDAAMDAGEQPSMVIDSPEEDEYPAVEEPEAESKPEETPPEPEAVSADKEPDSSLTEQEEAKAPSPKEKSKYAKNRERLNKTWAAANEVREQNKRDRQAIEQAQAELEKQRQQLAATQGYRDEHGHTAKDYEEAAKGFRDEGETKLAEAADRKVKELSEKQNQAVRQANEAKHWETLEAKRQELMLKHPDLQNADSELTKRANALLQAHPQVANMPDGLQAAVNGAVMQMEAEKGKNASTELSELRERYNKLEKKLSVTGGFTAGKADGEKGFDDMSDEEQTQYLMRAASAHDDSL
mgnify:FL=1|tara:strand:- start:44 stop:991 length:948 start_codon:yes stop_codon:yes gene_type:complete